MSLNICRNRPFYEMKHTTTNYLLHVTFFPSHGHTCMHIRVWCRLILHVTTNYLYQLLKCLPVANLIALLLPAV